MKKEYLTPKIQIITVRIEESILNSSVVVNGNTPSINEEIIQKKEDEWIFDYED